MWIMWLFMCLGLTALSFLRVPFSKIGTKPKLRFGPLRRYIEMSISFFRSFFSWLYCIAICRDVNVKVTVLDGSNWPGRESRESISVGCTIHELFCDSGIYSIHSKLVKTVSQQTVFLPFLPVYSAFFILVEMKYI
jgi:hypothetical protein